MSGNYYRMRAKARYVLFFCAQINSITEALNAPDPATNANFYRVSADYYKATADYPLYYHNALLYLSSVSDLSQIPLAIQQERAGDLALSALLGDGLYTFGHLVPFY